MVLLVLWVIRRIDIDFRGGLTINEMSALLPTKQKEPSEPSSSNSIQIQTLTVWHGDKETKMNPPPNSPDQQRKPMTSYGRSIFTSPVRRTSSRMIPHVSCGPCPSYGEDLEESGQENISMHSLLPSWYNYTPNMGRFQSQLHQKVLPKDESQEVCNKLKCLLQGRSLTQDYVTRFNASQLCEYPEISLIECSRTGWHLSLNKWLWSLETLSHHAAGLAGTGSTSWPEQKDQRVQNLIETGRGRYLYLDSIFQNQEAARRTMDGRKDHSSWKPGGWWKNDKCWLLLSYWKKKWRRGVRKVLASNAIGRAL